MKETIGEYEVTLSSELELATVTKPGLLVPEVVHTEEGPDAFERCMAWARGDSAPSDVKALIQTERQLTRVEAVSVYESGAWKGLEAFDLAFFQLFQDKLCVPFDVFHKAIEDALGRPVWTQEFGFNREGLKAELLGVASKPSMSDILELIPQEKRIVIDITPAE